MNPISAGKNVLKKTAKIVGYNLILQKIVKYDEDYEFVLPYANYAPWVSDKCFNQTYEKIKNYSLVDKYRCYELWQLVDETSKLEGALIEVGVWRGGSGALIANKAKLSGITDNVYLCDTFAGVVKAGKKDSRYKGGEHADTSKQVVEDLINKMKLDNVKILIGVFPEETSHHMHENVFRFCHVDVDVYQSAKDIVEWLWPKLVIGGIVVFDDYGFFECNGVTKYVNQERRKKDRLVIHNLNGHAILIKTKKSCDTQVEYC